MSDILFQSIRDALKGYDRAALQAEVQAAEQQRQEIRSRFPREGWSTLPLEQYALGQPNSTETFCYSMEFNSPALGSIRGGAASKHLIYKHKNKPGWYFPDRYGNEQEAWTAIRSGFNEALALAAAGDWEQIDEIETLAGARAIRLKMLYLYFPDQILPICSWDHLVYFFKRSGLYQASMKNWNVVRLNRALLAELQTVPALKGWSTKEIEEFLYYWADPRQSKRVVKIAPGEKAKYWEECLANGYICVGWDDVGDLREFESKEAFEEQFLQAFAGSYNNHQATLSKKARELWALMDLEAGDIIIANNGISKVLAVGEVVEPSYEWQAERSEFKHTVRVKWDTAYAQEIEPQKRWGMVTVAPVPVELYQRVLSRSQSSQIKPVVPIPAIYLEIAEALERKGQAILYGPPGTGKTYQARQFATWWLLHRQQDSQAEAVLANPELRRQYEKRLTTSQLTRRVWWIVANPKEWTWDTLFVEKRVTYRYGRIRGNYPLVQPGDLVVGYQAAPDKRLMALARVTKGLGEMTDANAGLEIEPVFRLTQGLTYAELQADPVLANSEPMRHRCQGTLFALTQREAESLFATLAERDSGLETHLDPDGGSVGPLTWVTFHPSYSYEDFVEGFRPVESGGNGLVLSLEDGLFKRICREAQANPGQPYLLMIDEINRANLAKVFGELITLLEKDKRNMVVTLPQSKESFVIPPNVYLLGTMNTADRSIKLLDVALRRRFAFREMMPDLDLLEAVVNNLHLGEFLRMLNQRIAQTEGREKQIGHAVLLEDGQPVTEPEEFVRRFRQEILPLLQEYCYDDYATLATYLGEKLVDAVTHTMKETVLADTDQLIEALVEQVKIQESTG